jgi:hypothetical protein
MRDPHSGGEPFATDVTERQHETVGRLFNTDKIARQVTHCEDLTRNIERSVLYQTGCTQTTMHLRGFEDRNVQLSVISL